MWRFLIPVGLFAALVAFFYFGIDRDKQTLPSPLIGKPAPQWQLSSVTDPSVTVSSDSFAGKPYVLNVWATWCVACRQEHEALLAISRRGEVPIVGLDWKDDREQAQRWLQQLGNPYTVTGFDDEGRAAIDWGVYGAPETFLIDAQGKVVFKHISPMTIAIWEREFLPRLNGSGAK
jgi:cytochrome c biogenesis protein CcmG/thiol:disulfide interchange protein DsbE